MNTYPKQGYLDTPYRIFHLEDTSTRDFTYHYHDFDKILIFLKGDVSYIIEGRTYQLRPYDIVLVPHNTLHRPIVSGSMPYERIIFYILPEFLKSCSPKEPMDYCFLQGEKEQSNLVRLDSFQKSKLYRTIKEFLDTLQEKDIQYGHTMYMQVLMMEFLVHLNRAIYNDHISYVPTNTCNTKILHIIDYINEHLTEDLSIDTLSEHFYISKYHMMRLFKQEIGYTMNHYISYKRLLLAKEQIAGGMPVTSACYNCGYHDYSTFSRAYKKEFGHSPKKFS